MTSSTKVKLHTSSTCRSAPTFSFTSRNKETDPEERPGPGKYGVPSVKEKYKSSPSFGFGSSKREFTKEWKGLPGPGAHTPFDPNQTSPMWGFGSGARIPKPKDTGVPAPGKYNLPAALNPRNMSLGGRHEGPKRKSSLPGPGAYMPQHDQVEHTPLRVSLGSESRDKNGWTKSFSCAPGPGTYPTLQEMGGNVATRSCPNFSFQSRRKPAKSDASPGPSQTLYSQF
uniref:Uncharacterized protein n=1 Tax=Alexandrium catenella TaxID=2925 RepID=A0A7S1LMR0_ALECA|mmetsp:Transcript_11564/g.31523  ORF Transcript_11564/g.31523 Transcript_11564/m.31523 type:complete len:227 (+) Transcript_11564:112-792(+)|eukprot:CAMPEP_0171163180 /NCGR_PEP_ID=MMETSP0790-20130122/5002_1 /TAXON_ID=2925 /ORGANISM="Alexandrium catenella, Strain OF101" /LENGTH=226 /DNA_ID=CAMNT_0011627861 /DNA_START=112 /DNA_END=792 /DNA_ORIENTATION=+